MWMGEQPSPILQRALELLSQGKAGEAEMAVKKAAMEAKARHGSGSHPLACAYADIGRLHLRMGEFQKAALEFQHASKGPMPADVPSRRDRLGFMYGFAEALAGLGKHDEAEKVLRQCVTFVKSLDGPTSAAATAANAPVAAALLKAGRTAEALKLAQETYDALWSLGDMLITKAIPVRAEAIKASGRNENAFMELADLPDELASQAVTDTIAWAPHGDPARARAILADLLAFTDKRFGDGHALGYDVLAAIARHEERQGDSGDDAVRKNAVRRSVWSFAVRRVPGGLLANLEVGFEPGGTLHLVPHLAREATDGEAAQLETVLTQAVDEMYARSA
jgi:ATP/maltotriose-dependent transcriptional regulator MalT